MFHVIFYVTPWTNLINSRLYKNDKDWKTNKKNILIALRLVKMTIVFRN